MKTWSLEIECSALLGLPFLESEHELTKPIGGESHIGAAESLNYTLLNATVRSQLLASELNLAIWSYFSTYIIIIKIIIVIVIITLILVHNLTRVNYFCFVALLTLPLYYFNVILFVYTTGMAKFYFKYFDVQYSHNVVFSFERSLNGENHSSSGSQELINPPAKFLISTDESLLTLDAIGKTLILEYFQFSLRYVSIL